MPLCKPTQEWRTHLFIHFCILTFRSGNEELSFVMLCLLEGNWGKNGNRGATNVLPPQGEAADCRYEGFKEAKKGWE